MNSSNRALITTEKEDTEVRPALVSATSSALVWPPSVVQQRNDVASYLEIPFIHKRLLIVCTLLGLLGGWAAILLWPRTYESEARLMIRVGRESVALDPTATTSATLMIQKTQEEEIISALEILNSRQVAETVVDRIGADEVLRGKFPDAGGAHNDGSAIASVKENVSQLLYSLLHSAGVKDDISDRELAVRELQSTVRVYSPKMSAVITIDARSKTAQMAQAIVSEVTSSFLDEHSKAAHTNGSRDFFEQQSQDVEQRLTKLVADRAEFMQNHEIISIATSRQLLQQQLSGIDRDLVTANSELKKAVSEIEDLESKIASSSNEIDTAADPTWGTLRQRIYELELEERRFAAIYTAEHPKLKQTVEQLEGAREVLGKLRDERLDETITPNPTKMRLREQLQQHQTNVVGLRSFVEKKESQRADLELQTNELLEWERQLTETDRDIQQMEDSLRMLREKLEQARVIDELQSTSISNVHVFQPATFVERAVSPKKKILAAGCILLGLTTGVGLCFLRHTTSSSLRTRADVEHHLGVPVVSSIPRLRRIKSPRLKNQNLYREKCQDIFAELMLSLEARRQARGRSLAIVGVNSGAGASTLAGNLAMSSSVDFRLKTILVDADSHRRSVSEMFELNGKPGLLELVNGSASHDECRQSLSDASVDLIASAADSCEEILTASAPEIVQALQAYQHDCDLLIVDLPAASQPGQAVTLAQHLDGVLVVIESEKTQILAAERLLRRLTESGTEVIGVVLTKTQSYLPKLIQRFVTPQD